MARILIVTNTDFFMRLFLEPLVTELDRRGHAVELCCNGNALGRVLGGHVWYSFDFPKHRSVRSFLRATASMRRLLLSGNFDVVNSHNRNSSIVVRLASIGTKTKSVYTANGYYFNDDQSTLEFAASMGLEAVLSLCTDLTLSQTKEDLQLMQRMRLQRNRALVIGNGTALTAHRTTESRMEIERRLRLPTGVLRFIGVGRLVEGKGFTDLLEAFAKLEPQKNKLELLQVGDTINQDISPFKEAFIERMHELGVAPHVRMTGMTEDVPSHLLASDVYVSPSRWEGLSRSLTEAMALGLPVVCSRIRGAREVVRDDVDGLLYPSRDIGALTASLRRILRMSPEERSRMGEAARRRAASLFDLDAYTKRQADGIESALETKTMSA